MSFDLLAPVYRWMEFICAGDKLQRCRVAFLDEVPAPRRILILGEGHGRSVVECLRRFPAAEIICVEASAGMIAQARGNIERHGLEEDRVTFIHADVLTWEPPTTSFDLIITHYFLDCFRADQLNSLVPKIAHLATDDANWMIADFQIAASGWRRWRTQIILWLLYTFFRVATRLPATELAPTDALLTQAGFVLHRRVDMEWGLLKSEWWQRVGSSLRPTPL